MTAAELRRRLRDGGHGVTWVLDGAPGEIRFVRQRGRELVLRHGELAWCTSPRWQGGVRVTRTGESSPVSEITLRLVRVRDDVTVTDLAAVVALVASGLYRDAGGWLGNYVVSEFGGDRGPLRP